MKLLVPACQLNTAETMGLLLGCSILTSLNHIFLFTDKSWRVLLSKSFSRSPHKLLWWGGNSSIFNDGEGRLTQRMPCCCARTLGCLALFGPNKLTAYSKELVWWVAFFFSPFCSLGTGSCSSQGWCGVYQRPDRLPSSRLLSAQGHHVSNLALWLKRFARGAN